MAFRFTGFADEASKDLATQIAITKDAGWKSIELRGVQLAGQASKNVCDLNDEEWKKAYDLLQAGGITIAGFGGQIANWGRPITTDFEIDKAELRRAAPHMRQAGVKLIRIMSYPNAAEAWPVADWRKEVFRRLKELATIAEGEGVVLGHENCNGYAGIGPKETLEMLDAVDSKALTLIFDTGNNTLHGHHGPEATWDFYDKVKQHVTHVHIKAGKANAKGEYATCYVDEDPVQARILADLKKNGYDGWLSIEPHLAAQIHAGIEADDATKARHIYIEYTKRIEAMVKAL